MRNKKYLMILVIVTASLSLMLSIGCRKQNQNDSIDHTTQGQLSENSDQTMDRRLIAYYFHGTFRCQTCLKIEELTRETVTSRFRDELDQGILQLKIINSDEPENQHFNKLFQLENQAVILAVYHNNEMKSWKNLPRIWELYDNNAEFENYIYEEIMSVLSEPG